MLVCGAKARYPERRCISECSAEVGGRGPVPRRYCERVDDRGRIVAEKALGKRRMIRPISDVLVHGEEVRQLPTGLLAQRDEIDRLAPGGPFLRPPSRR